MIREADQPHEASPQGEDGIVSDIAHGQGEDFPHVQARASPLTCQPFAWSDEEIRRAASLALENINVRTNPVQEMMDANQVIHELSYGKALKIQQPCDLHQFLSLLVT